MILEMQKTIQVIYEKFHLQKCWLSFSHILDLESGSRTNIQKYEY